MICKRKFWIETANGKILIKSRVADQNPEKKLSLTSLYTRIKYIINCYFNEQISINKMLDDLNELYKLSEIGGIPNLQGIIIDSTVSCVLSSVNKNDITVNESNVQFDFSLSKKAMRLIYSLQIGLKEITLLDETQVNSMSCNKDVKTRFCDSMRKSIMHKVCGILEKKILALVLEEPCNITLESIERFQTPICIYLEVFLAKIEKFHSIKLEMNPKQIMSEKIERLLYEKLDDATRFQVDDLPFEEIDALTQEATEKIDHLTKVLLAYNPTHIPTFNIHLYYLEKLNEFISENADKFSLR